MTCLIPGFGYTLTTLSKNYNPKNFDESWVCVFCRQPPHHNGLGDLFGPYYVPTTQWKKLNLPSPQKANKDLASSFILGGSDQAGAKAKRKLQQQKKKVIESASPTKASRPIDSTMNSPIQSGARSIMNSNNNSKLAAIDVCSAHEEDSECISDVLEGSRNIDLFPIIMFIQ